LAALLGLAVGAAGAVTAAVAGTGLGVAVLLGLLDDALVVVNDLLGVGQARGGHAALLDEALLEVFGQRVH
jgi:hypothetical protein